MKTDLKTQLLDSFYIPASDITPTSSQKVMIILHGLGDSLESYKVFTQEINVTGLSYLLLNAPKKYYFGHSWYDIPPSNPVPGIENSVRILTKIIDEIVANNEHIDYSDIFIGGFSQGGCISLETAYLLQHKLGGIVLMSPRIYPERRPQELSNCLKKTDIFCAHGSLDPVIDINQTRAGIEHLVGLGANAQFHAYEMEHEIDIDEVIQLRNWLNQRL
ncbi:phospholipase/carboxylesterase [Bacteriovorax sp. BAL6_X]|uniref:alpha/beta hydrolase n=1 Tax=Bacteriovorax sp. BAL6_X TaxID=1201290 RepID=UPI0003864135|nr:alpha/beta fold hydrolase [Bacteriovorax sp. BAL6_X]EPZ51866.1 phospholipase/carboxylesterase [Bacteriovorax sp. BAL6_X]